MKRLTQGSRVLYVQRHRGWSFLLLLSGATLLAIAPEAWGRRDWGFCAVLTAGALACCAAAVAYLLKARVLVIDLAENRLRVLTRRPFRRTVVSDHSPKAVRVRVRGHASVHSSKSGSVRRERQDVFVELSDGTSFALLSGVGAPHGEFWGRRLAEDLGGEPIVDSREW